ncbi:MAG: hypothetical protein P1U69_05800 [Parvibaculaceae bacterium]|nr:hypothetical protein [Parvibaculaceae bacterium]|tara:strand:- start:1073 stop:1363 length:291 start_codon:yes stop_codon:yes gene_type:complete
MSIVKKIIAALILAASLYTAYMIYQQSTLAGVLFVILALTVVVPLAVGTAQRNSRIKTNIGEMPDSKMDVGVRQARATIMREDGEVRGAPARKQPS